MRLYISIVASLILAVTLIVLLPMHKRGGYFFVVNNGDSLTTVSNKLYKNGYTNFPFVFKYVFKITEPASTAKSGTYYLKDVTSLFQLSHRIATADFQVELMKVTIPEGQNVFQTAEILKDKLPNFDEDTFLDISKNSEGFLFPDTYLFSPNQSEQEIYDVMIETYNKKVGDLFDTYDVKDEIKRYKILILASIVEEEASKFEDRKMIAGVLNNRLKIDMPLQVDVTFQYINGKNSYQLTTEDLKNDSPYNTYVNKGLPPTPISNPSLDAITAVLDPEESDYLYFLSSKSGVIYYAQTFEQHKENKRKYYD